MPLPAGFSRTLTCGLAALRSAERWLTARLARELEVEPQRWLALRRLRAILFLVEEADDWKWESGFGFSQFDAVDVELLAQLEAEYLDGSPYPDNSSQVLDPDVATALGDLRKLILRGEIQGGET